MKKISKALAIAALAATSAVYVPTASAVPVSLELALLVDVSGSVDNSEYLLQRNGYVQAFQNAAIQANIASLVGGIAVTYIEWSGASQQSTRVIWTLINDAASANSFAALIAASTRAFSGQTAPGSAINFAVPLFNGNGYESARQVIDVSGDGEQNDGATTSAARTAALAAGIDAINGLPIAGGAFLNNWYAANIVGGTNSFNLPAASFADFDSAVATKIGREITNQVPEPGSLALAGLALLGMFGLRRKQGA